MTLLSKIRKPDYKSVRTLCAMKRKRLYRDSHLLFFVEHPIQTNCGVRYLVLKMQEHGVKKCGAELIRVSRLVIISQCVTSVAKR